MPFVNAKCTNCGGTLSVDNTRDAWICDYCHSPFIVEKAINNFNVTNNNTIHANTVNIYGGNSADFAIRGGVLEKYNGASTKAVIPDTVTHIGNNAFANCIGLTEVIIPRSVVSIGVRAFSCCSSLHSINIPESVVAIHTEAFSRCSSLRSIYIPESVVTIGPATFKDCSSLENVKMPSKVRTYGGYLFMNCIRLQSVVIPNGATSISCFKGCKSLTYVQLPNTVKRISSFQDCTSLEGITIPYGTEVLDDTAFIGCINLRSIAIPNTVKKIGVHTFRNCNNLVNINCESLTQFADQFPVVRQRKEQGNCLYCGGKFSLLGKCKVCGRKKDY